MKILKTMLATIFAFVMMGTTGNVSVVASAYSFESEADKLMFATIKEIFSYENKNDGKVVMEKVTLYDIELKELDRRRRIANYRTVYRRNRAISKRRI